MQNCRIYDDEARYETDSDNLVVRSDWGSSTDSPQCASTATFSGKGPGGATTSNLWCEHLTVSALVRRTRFIERVSYELVGQGQVAFAATDDTGIQETK